MGGRKLYILLQPWLEEHCLKIGRDSLFILLSGHNLLIKTRRRRYISTTDSNHWMRKYPNLTVGLKLFRTEQLWVSDITYVRILEVGHAYLALITDAFSHKIVGHCLALHMEASMCVEALELALKTRIKTNELLIHHSDRGAQYCSHQYTQKLHLNGIGISMTESGDPLENPVAERINGIIKNEYINPLKPASFMEAKELVSQSIMRYNHERPHASIDYNTPSQMHFLNQSVRRRW